MGDRPLLDVRLQAGRLDVEAGPPGEVVVSLNGRAVEDVEVNRSGDVVLVRRPTLGASWFGSSDVRAYIVVPPGTAVTFGLASCNARFRGDLGDLNGKTASGNVLAESVVTATVKTASGDVTIERVAGRADVASASGDLRLGVVEGDVGVTSASGDLRVERVMGNLRVSTASGDARVERAEGSEINARSVSGDVWVGIPAGTRLEVDVNTLSGRVRFPPRSAAADSGGSERRLVRFSAKTVSGDVEVARV